MATVERPPAKDPALEARQAPNGRTDRQVPREAPSVLSERGELVEIGEAPACFGDLNLDQAVDAITDRREDYQLKPIFYAPLQDAETIVYRQEVMRDTEREEIKRCVGEFAQGMRRMRSYRQLVGKLRYKRQREAWFLETIDTYCKAVRELSGGLADAVPASRGLRAVADYLAAYIRSAAFLALDGETKRLTHELAAIRYAMTIADGSVRVSDFDGDEDYGAQVQQTFARFRQGPVTDHRARFATLQEMGHVEAAVLEFATRFHADVFTALERYCERNGQYVDDVVGRFEREAQFYLAFHEYTEPVRAAGLQLCYPHVSASKDVEALQTFDLPLARKLTREQAQVITNDWQLEGAERIFVVSGPNQGGKTTFARTFGQLHYLASLGCPVPGTHARLLLFDRLLTHFEKQEDLSSRRGKLEDDLIRVHDILQLASDRTIVVMNESFTSTTLEDATFLGTRILERMIALDLLGVYVTFVDELASLGPSVVSAMSTVDEHDPTVRTFKIVRRPASGLAYAAAIAEKYGLTYQALRDRVGS